MKALADEEPQATATWVTVSPRASMRTARCSRSWWRQTAKRAAPAASSAAPAPAGPGRRGRAAAGGRPGWWPARCGSRRSSARGTAATPAPATGRARPAARPPRDADQVHGGGAVHLPVMDRHAGHPGGAHRRRVPGAVGDDHLQHAGAGADELVVVVTMRRDLVAGREVAGRSTSTRARWPPSCRTSSWNAGTPIPPPRASCWPSRCRPRSCSRCSGRWAIGGGCGG